MEVVRSTNRDWFLSELIRMANATQSEFGITLSVSGLIVSGNVISGVKYFESFAENFQVFAGDDEEFQSQLKEYILDMGSVYKTSADEEKEYGPETLPQFIHLSSAKFYKNGVGPLPSNGMLWRGNLDEVSGFTLGRLEEMDGE